MCVARVKAMRHKNEMMKSMEVFVFFQGCVFFYKLLCFQGMILTERGKKKCLGSIIPLFFFGISWGKK